MKTVCKECGSDNIQQQATIYLNPNDLENFTDWNSLIWEDDYWCLVCDEECEAKEIEQIASRFKKSHLGPGQNRITSEITTTYNDTREINKGFMLQFTKFDVEWGTPTCGGCSLTTYTLGWGVPPLVQS